MSWRPGLAASLVGPGAKMLFVGALPSPVGRRSRGEPHCPGSGVVPVLTILGAGYRSTRLRAVGPVPRDAFTRGPVAVGLVVCWTPS